MDKRQIEKKISLIPARYNTDLVFNDTEYAFILKKTEKVIMAIYIITDFIPSNEGLRNSLKDNCHNVLDSVCDLFYIRTNRINHLQKIKAGMIKLFSQLNLAEIAGFITPMNAEILRNEISNMIKLSETLERDFEDEQVPQFKQNQFDVNIRNKRQYRQGTESREQRAEYKRQSKGQSNKDNVLYKKDPKLFNVSSNNINNIKNNTTEEREDRVFSVIKDKKTVSIKDISSVILDCSEKTIQRTLNNLIDKNKIKKTGERRWARYELI